MERGQIRFPALFLWALSSAEAINFWTVKKGVVFGYSVLVCVDNTKQKK